MKLLLTACIVVFFSSCSIGDYNSKELFKLQKDVKFDRIEVNEIIVPGNWGGAALGGKTIIKGGEISVFDNEGKLLVNINSNDKVGAITTYYKNGNQAIQLFYDTEGEAGIWKVDKRNISRNYITTR